MQLHQINHTTKFKQAVAGMKYTVVENQEVNQEKKWFKWLKEGKKQLLLNGIRKGAMEIS